MAAILFVRVKSQLDEKELELRLIERKPWFLEVPSLLQKIHGRDEFTGNMCGIYFFDTREALNAFRESELAKTIPGAYEAVEVRPQIYNVLYPLRPERDSFV